MAIWKRKLKGPDIGGTETPIPVGGRDVPVEKDAVDFDPPANPALIGPGFSWHKLPEQAQLTTKRRTPRLVTGPYSVKKFNQNHEPAGTAEGGQFASATGGDDPEAKFHELKRTWAQINEQLRPMMGNPNSPEAKQKLGELKDISKQIFALDTSKGGMGEVGHPGPTHDLLVVGGGPAGMSAAINAGAEGLNTVLVDANERPGGQARFSSRIENFAGFPIGVTGQQLTESMAEQAARMGADIESGVRVTGMTYDDKTGLKTVTLSDGTTRVAKAVILAGGVEFRKLSFEGSNSPAVVVGDGQKLSEISVGKPAVVVGGSNGAAQAALGVAQSASHVYLIARRPISDTMSDYQIQAVRANPKITIMEDDEVKALLPAKDKEYELTTTKGTKLETAAVGVFIGSGPTTSWLPSEIQLAKGGKDNGKVVVNTDYETAIPGVYAVGDTIVNGPERIMASAGQGQIAVRNMFQYLNRSKELKKSAKKKDIQAWNDLVDAMYAADISDDEKFQPEYEPHLQHRKLLAKDSSDVEPTDTPDNSGRPKWMTSPGEPKNDPQYRSQKPDGNKDTVFSHNVNKNPPDFKPVDQDDYIIW